MDRLNKYSGLTVFPLRTKVGTTVKGATRIPSRRKSALTSAIVLSTLIMSATLFLAHPFSVYGTTVTPGSLPSWNPAVSCTALLTTIEAVIGNQANSNGGATFGGGGFLPGIPNKRSTTPPCTVNGNATFVEIHGVKFPSSYTVEDCASYPNGNFCDTTFNVQDPNCANSDVYLCTIHLEIDQAWKSAGIAPGTPPVSSQLFNIQGFVYWDPNNNSHFADQWHSYSGWEIHPLTAWRLSSGSTTASFTYSPASPSTGSQVSFTATASGGTQPYSFSWNFGDGSTGTGSTATHAYSAAGSYTVVLTVKDSSSPQQTATSQQTLTVTSRPPPPLTASFTYSPSSPVAGQQVTFTASASGGTPPYSFAWNFGDGSTGIGATVSHTYGTAGTFTVTLTTNDKGSPQQSTNSQQSLTVASPPPPALTASFTYTPSNPNVGQTVSFAGSASGGTQPYSYSWTFGDGGTASGRSVTHSYQAAGSYNVVLTVTDAPGQTANSAQTVTVSNPPPPPLTASFSYAPASPLVGQQVTFTALATGGTAPYSFSWSFGDGSIGTGSSVSHVYSSPGTFNVILIVSDSGSPQQTANSQQSVTVSNPPPPPLTSSFSYSPTSPQVGQQVSFSGSASGGTSPYSFSWSFGDGTTGTGSSTTHTYSSAGTFNVILTVSDSGSPQQTSSSQNSITVTSPPPPPLTVSFAFSPSSPQTDQQVTFTASASSGTTPYSFSWTFGDGSSGTGSTVTHAYASAGTFTVVLTVKDSGSPQQTVTSQQSVTVTSPPPPPLSASFTFNPSSPNVGQSVSFTGSASGGAPPYSYSWSFGDSGTGSGSSVSHTFQSNGAYTVVLTITDSSGQTATSSQTITVNSPLSASISYSPSNPTVLTPVMFTGSATGGTGSYTYSWDFGDGTTGTGSSVSHIYLLPGTYTVTLTVTDANGQTATSTVTVTVSLPLV